MIEDTTGKMNRTLTNTKKCSNFPFLIGKRAENASEGSARDNSLSASPDISVKCSLLSFKYANILFIN